MRRAVYSLASRSEASFLRWSFNDSSRYTLGLLMRRLSTVLLGDAAVTVRCGQMLLESGHSVLGVVTGDGRVASWAAENRIACCFLSAQATLTHGDVEALVAGAPFDLLLSVHNLRILPPALLASPRWMAINYHDAPLPRYAGLHATSWAIDQGEHRHGIGFYESVAPVKISGSMARPLLGRCPSRGRASIRTRCSPSLGRCMLSCPSMLRRLPLWHTESRAPADLPGSPPAVLTRRRSSSLQPALAVYAAAGKGW